MTVKIVSSPVARIEETTVADQGPVHVEEVGSADRDGDQGGQGEVGDGQPDREDDVGVADQRVAEPGAQQRQRQQPGAEGEPPELPSAPLPVR